MIGSLALGSCKKFLDINTDPNKSTSVEPKLLFGYAVTAWDVNKNSGDSWMNLGFIGQTIANGGDFSDNWGAFDIYDLSQNSMSNNFRMAYSTAGNNLVQAIKIAESSSPANNNAAAQCKILLAQIMFETTMNFGDIPYSQAFEPEKYPNPKYDSQKDILEDLLLTLDEAKSQMDPTSPLKIADYDIFYSGDLAKWKKYANSLKFKILMVMVDKDPSKASAIAALVQDPSQLVNAASENVRVPYSTTPNNENPKYRLFLEDNPFTYANKVMTDIMVPKNDPRLSKYFDLPAGETQYIGVESNVDADKHTALLGKYMFRKDAPSLIVSYQEMLFLEAEVYARGIGVTKDISKANDLYKAALIEAMRFYEVPQVQIDNYIANNLVDLRTAADPVKEIHLEQWVDLMDRPVEAFIQWRRSGPEGSEVPTLKVPFGATSGALLRRYILPSTETNSNSSAPSPIPPYYEKVWFDL
ncbi:hypothetical protein Pedsa_3142 [Pseudopedobacter saltans DSM 12145]|uniref:SusD/RagB family nutrient-binding outer membrane lipoprotein n=2 Tax=Pseudopedobacter saltans TaxID=151895 RepID=F0SAQ9_PSESL|nr:hypothetical protein Pedsa_3142 [Pseudopedobacter saltans DSM 12145]